jgi:hypothetical protein
MMPLCWAIKASTPALSYNSLRPTPAALPRTTDNARKRPQTFNSYGPRTFKGQRPHFGTLAFQDNEEAR